LGERVFDERLTLFTDPNDPMGGDFPFFADDATPSGASTWIEGGVLRALSYNPGDAAGMGKTPIQQPYSLHMLPAPGTTTATIEEMIASCARGIYVHRFSGVKIMDFGSAAMAGTTRDGCFLVKDGKIHGPVANFRFYESPFLMCNRIMAVGVAERVAFGYRPSTSWGGVRRDDQWPFAPIIVPPLMVRDFNFSSLSDAV
jgi:predicted Zn-dependent protease